MTTKTTAIAKKRTGDSAPGPAASKQDVQEAQDVRMAALLSYRLHSVANLLSRSATLRYKREFGVTLWEWRTIALVGAQQGMLLKELAKLADLDKSQVSRVVTGLTERGLLTRTPDENDARGIRLFLTKTGKKIYEGLIRAAGERNDIFLQTLSQQERKTLGNVLLKLESIGRDIIEREKVLGNNE